MTARRFTQPIRHADDRDDALAEVERRREELTAVRRLARERKAGACDVVNAEYRLHLALRRVDSDGWSA